MNDFPLPRQKRILITGASSFSALHLTRLLATEPRSDLYGTSRSHSQHACWKNYFVGDITDKSFIDNVVETTSPTHIFHLAGVTDTEKLDELLLVNLKGTWNLLKACRKLPESAKLLIVGSAASYGEMEPSEKSLPPSRPAKPNSLYGWVREKSFELASLLGDQSNLDIKFCRTFNLIGPGLPEKYAPTAIILRMLARSKSDSSVFSVACSDSVRDFVDVRDACRAWLGILESGETAKPYSIGSGIPVTILQLTELIRDRLGMTFPIASNNEIASAERSTIRKSIADTESLERDIKWTRYIKLEQSIDDMLSHLRCDN